MCWKIKFKVNKLADSPTSIIRIDAEDLREACAQVLSIYRNATILSYQETGQIEKIFQLSDVSIKMKPVTSWSQPSK